ncbi:glycosyltransferase [Flammeovirgaceae bacterium]
MPLEKRIKVNYYFRNPSPSNYSIENVFSTVSEQLSDEVDIYNHYTTRNFDPLSIFEVSKHEANIYHITGAVNYLALGLPSKSTVITVHDIGHYTETLKGLKKYIYKELFWRIPLGKTNKITAISNFTRESLIEYFNIDPDRIKVIYKPVNPLFKLSEKRIVNSRPVIMQIGAGKNKNIETLLKAVVGLDVHLLLVSKPNEDIVSTLNALNISFEFRYNLTETELYKAYHDCDILYFGSTYEGFGLPVIESQVVGRPVIISDIPTLKEIAGASAFQTELNNSESVRQGIVDLISNYETYLKYVDLGKKNASRFSVSTIANQYLELYNEMMEEK